MHHQTVENPASAPHRHAFGRKRRQLGGDGAECRKIARPAGDISHQQSVRLVCFLRIVGDDVIRTDGFFRHQEEVFQVGGVRPFDNRKTRRLDHANERAFGEMVKMLVDEPFLDDVIGADQRDVRGIENQEPAVLQTAPMIGENMAGMRQMLDRVAGMDDVEAPAFERYTLDAPDMQLGTLQAGTGQRHAFVRLDRGYGGVGSFVQQGANEAAAVGTDVEQRKRVRRVAMAQHGIDGDLGAETLAVAHVAPIGAARYGRGRAWSAVGARQALHQPAFRANVHADVS